MDPIRSIGFKRQALLLIMLTLFGVFLLLSGGDPRNSCVAYGGTSWWVGKG